MSPSPGRLPRLAGRRVLLVTHQLDLSGSPLFLTELGGEMVHSGAVVTLVNLSSTGSAHLATRHGIRLCPPEASFDEAALADLVLANTAVTKSWIRQLLERRPSDAGKVLWWIHEIDTERFGGAMECSERVRAAAFDSQASMDGWQAVGLRLPPLARVVHLGVRDAFMASSDAARWAYPRTGLWARLGPASLRREAIRCRLGVEPEEFLLLLIGHYASIKGQDLLVRTLGRLPGDLRVRLLLCGFDRHNREQFLSGLNPTERRAVGVGRLLWCPTEQLAALYAASDAYVMNSQGAGENFGRVTTEAMAFRLPVLGTDAGGTRELVVAGVTGLLHPVGEAGQQLLAVNITRLVRDRRLAREMGLRGRERVREHFSEERFYERLEPLLAAATA